MTPFFGLLLHIRILILDVQVVILSALFLSTEYLLYERPAHI